MNSNDIILSMPPGNERKFKFLVWQPPVNLAYLAAYLRNHGFKPQIQDYAICQFNEDMFRKYIQKTKPLIFGVYCMTYNILNGNYICQIVKKESPETFTIVGGPHCSAIPKETLEEFSGFDIAVVGEGENTLLEIAQAVYEKKSLKGIAGIYYRENNTIIRERSRELIKDIDSLPFPARDLFDWDFCKKVPHQAGIVPTNHFATPVYTSRGCPYKCSFCAAPLISGQNSVRLRSSDNVLAEIEELKSIYGIDHIIFQDDTFMLNKSRIREICQGIKEIGIKTWSCDAKVNTVDQEILHEMSESGCMKISYGIESGSERILRLVKKQITIDQVRNAVRWSKDAKIQIVAGTFIIGAHPSETKEEIEQTRRLLLELPLDLASVSIITPFPGTEVYRWMREGNYFQQENWSDFMLITEERKWRTEYFSGEDLTNMQKKMINQFYFSPRYFIKLIKRLENFKEILYYIENGIEYIKYVLFNK